MTAIRDFAGFNAVHDAGLAKLLPPRPRIAVGMGTCGSGNGAEAVMHAFVEAIDQRGLDIDLVRTGCFGFCAEEPLVNVRLPGQPLVILHRVQVNHVERILDEVAAKTVPADLALCRIEEWNHLTSHVHYGAGFSDIPLWNEVPFFRGQKKIVLRNAGLINPDDIEEYIAVGGYQALYKVLIDGKPEAANEQIKESGLRGRGGAGYSAGQKWEFLRKAVAERKFLICNADEGDPGAYMNRNEIESDPHALIEGMAIGAYITGATDGVIYIRAEYPLAVHQLKVAIGQAREYGLLGKDILGRGFAFDIDVVEGAGAFVCGEETALIASLEGRAGRPRPRPPFPAQKGVWGYPTNINNVETWFNIAPIIALGPAWFSETGGGASSGTKVFSLVGKVRNTGLVEMPLGTPLGNFVHAVGGGGLYGHPIKAVQTGGPSGGCIPPDLFETPVDYESLGKLGAIMGSGGMVVMDEDNCMVDVARYFIQFTRSEILRQVHALPGRAGQGAAHPDPHHQGPGARGGSRRPRRTRADDPRHVALRARADGAQLAPDHHAAFPRRVRGPHSGPPLPRRRLPGAGAVAVREQLPAAHEHPALPRALQGGAARRRVRVRDHGQSLACLDRPCVPASVRQPLPASDGRRVGQHARSASVDRRQSS